MSFMFKSFEEFKQMRIKAAQWRAFEQQLAGISGEEIVREVLLVPTIDRRTDQGKKDHGYEKRLYEGFKEAMRRLHEGLPLDEEPREKEIRSTAMQVPKRDKFREACVALGYLPSEESAIQAPTTTAEESIDHLQELATEDDVRSIATLTGWSPPRTPNVQASPRRSPSTSPTTPYISGCETYSPQPSTPDVGWAPSSPTPSQIENMRNHGWSSLFQSQHSSFPEREPLSPPKPKRGRPRKGTQRPTPPSTRLAKKYRKRQSKFSDETLKKVRASPPRTRQTRRTL